MAPSGDLPVVIPDLVGIMSEDHEEPTDARRCAGRDRALGQRQTEQF